MPAAPRAAAPPATNCLLVRRTSGLLRLDLHEAGHDPIEVLHDLAVREAELGYDVLADRVERPVLLPGVEDVPGVGAPVDRVHVHGLAGDLPRPSLAAEAGLAVAGRDPGLARIAAEVHMDLAGAALEPDEPDQIAAALRDGVHAFPLAADPAGERVGKPAGAVDGRADLVGELLPAPRESRRARRFGDGRRRLLGRIGRGVALTAAAGEREGRDEEGDGSRGRPGERAIHELMMPDHRKRADGYPRSPCSSNSQPLQPSACCSRVFALPHAAAPATRTTRAPSTTRTERPRMRG